MSGDQSSVMRAVVMERHGGPDAQVLRHDVDVRTPEAGEAVVRVGAAALNNTDIWTREGAYGSAEDPDAIAGWQGVPIRTPRIQGGDMAGVVAAVGVGADPGLVGRRVLVDPADYEGDDEDATVVGLLGSEHDGGFAEAVVTAAARLHDVTDSPLDLVELACLPIAYGTAMGMRRKATVEPGDDVVVTGASGGVGLALVQLCAAAGARVLAVTTRRTAEEVRAAGADVILDRHQDLAAQTRAAAPDGVRAVFDVIGGPGFGAWVPLLGRHGVIVVAGGFAGPVVELDLRQLYLQERAILGSTMHSRADFAALVDLARRGAVRPVVAATHDLADIDAAQAQLRDPATVGKVVLRCDPDVR